MRSPGAVKSLSGPSLEKSHCVSADVVQVTAIASAYCAGNSTQFVHGPPFPAEAAMSAPFPCAYWTPSRSAEDPDGPPRLRLMTTRGPPLSAHQRIPEATTERGPEPLLDSTLTPWMPTWAMPAIPFALRSEEHTSELQSQSNLVCRLLLEKKKSTLTPSISHNRRP